MTGVNGPRRRRAPAAAAGIVANEDVSFREKGITVLLVEQNVFEALEISDRAYVLQSGRIVLEGTGAELVHSDLVRGAYLGSAGLA